MLMEETKNALSPGYDRDMAHLKGLSRVDVPIRAILKGYSNIEPDKVLAHVKDVRDRAFAVLQCPYPCVAKFMFLEPAISTLPCFDAIVERVKEGQKLLDMGCAFGQELRQLVYHGAPSENLYGVDLRLDFINLGFDLFRDRSSLKSQFFASNLLDSNSDAVVELTGKIDIIFASLFFHIFSWNQQITIAKHALQMLTPKPRSMIVGRNAAYVNRKTPPLPEEYTTKSFHHDLASWKLLWDVVQKETGMIFRMETWEQPDQDFMDHPELGAYMMYFTVTLE
ncbi:hypothetical protein CNMCM6936_003359 [Aspergillus lentulus]|nr:hypothetical protein CNMCM6069_003424 [Aspergillus lentulus]KAF4170171.1 hypothetical protein CNMCM6936_003359 [Aspergillus lentulus]